MAIKSKIWGGARTQFSNTQSNNKDQEIKEICEWENEMQQMKLQIVYCEKIKGQC